MAKTAKVTKLYYGTDSQGRYVEVALSDQNKWFSRSTINTEYGETLGKWRTEEAPTFSTIGTNVYTGEEFEYENPVIEWGFSVLKEMKSELPRYRLPKV